VLRLGSIGRLIHDDVEPSGFLPLRNFEYLNTVDWCSGSVKKCLILVI